MLIALIVEVPWLNTELCVYPSFAAVWDSERSSLLVMSPHEKMHLKILSGDSCPSVISSCPLGRVPHFYLLLDLRGKDLLFLTTNYRLSYSWEKRAKDLNTFQLVPLLLKTQSSGYPLTCAAEKQPDKGLCVGLWEASLQHAAQHHFCNCWYQPPSYSLTLIFVSILNNISIL